MASSATSHEAGDAAVVEDNAALTDRGAGERHSQPRIVELGILILHATDEAVGLHARKRFEHGISREESRRPEARPPGNRVVEPQAGGIEPPIPEPAAPAIRRNRERQPLHEMRRVGQEYRPLTQRLADERHIALGQIPHAAVHELRGPTRRCFREILGLEQSHRQASGGRIDRHAEPRRSAADHDEIERPLAIQAGKQFGTRGLRGSGSHARSAYGVRGRAGAGIAHCRATGLQACTIATTRTSPSLLPGTSYAR